MMCLKDFINLILFVTKIEELAYLTAIIAKSAVTLAVVYTIFEYSIFLILKFLLKILRTKKDNGKY